jgi:cytidylate kinase
MDGPSGSGKSSASKGVATALGLRYLDTGAMYRAMTHWMLTHEIPVDDPAAVAAACERPVLASGTDPAAPTVTVDGTDVSGPIRSAEVTAAVSSVAAVPEVRSRLVALQRSIIGDGGIVVEGRDIGTTVAPDATTKIYLTARPEVRALRRAAEVAGSALGNVAAESVAQTEQDLKRRDHVDSNRAASPLAQAADAHVVDGSDLTLDEVIATIVALVRDSAGIAAR